MKLENDNLNDEILESGVTVVDFYSNSCGPCSMMMPIFDMIEQAGTKVIKVDTEQFPALAAANGVVSLPTIQFYKDGELKETKLGATPKPVIESIIESLN